MRAAVLAELNRPYEIRDVPDPIPGPGEVRIRVHACGLCHTDLSVAQGHLKLAMTLPLVGGHEPVGVIDELGPGVTRFQKGDRVGVSWWQGGCGRCALCRQEKDRYCADSKAWHKLGGGNGELMIADQRGVTLLPDNLSFEAAAPLFCAGFTVVSGYRNADPKPGERVGVLGVGGLGHLAIQYAKAFGHEVLAVTNSDDKRALARELGADEVVVAGSHAGNAIAKAGGVDILLSTTTSAEQAAQSLTGLRPEGRLISMGVYTEPLSVMHGLMLGRQLTVKGSLQNKRADLIDALELVAKNKVKPRLELYPIERINEAAARLDQNKVRFRAVLLHA